MIDLAPEYLEKVRTILRQYVPQCEVRAFGSRVSWTAKDYSDLDLAVVGSGRLSDDTLRRLKEGFEESDLPFRVDVLDWHTASPEFQKVIEKQYEVVQGAKSKQIAREWVERSLGEVIVLQRGYDLPVQDRKHGQVPIVSSSGVSATHSDAKVAAPGVVTGRYGTIGEVFYLDRDFWPLNTTLYVKDFKGNNPRFVSYLLRTIDFQSCSDKSSVPGVNRNDLHRISVRVPPPAEQRAIAHILGTLDDKIELNRRMNETLEAMARAVFKSWFVDFDPVRAKAEGRDPGLPKPLADLFPNSFQASPLGMIPKGWLPTRWGKMVFLQYGKALSNYSHESGAYPVYGTNGRIGTCNEPLCRHPGIIIGRKGAYRGIHFCRTPFFVIDTAFYVVPKTPLNMRWAWYEMLRQDINSMDSGSAIPSTSREAFYALPVVVPPLQVQQQFASLLNPCWDYQAHNEDESRTLGALRDTLLPKLISGELRIKDAARLAGVA